MTTDNEIRERVVTLEVKEQEKTRVLDEIKDWLIRIDHKLDSLDDKMSSENKSNFSEHSDLRAKVEGLKARVIMISSGVGAVVVFAGKLLLSVFAAKGS
jgi:archaellum component FlaC